MSLFVLKALFLFKNVHLSIFTFHFVCHDVMSFSSYISAVCVKLMKSSFNWISEMNFILDYYSFIDSSMDIFLFCLCYSVFFFNAEYINVYNIYKCGWLMCVFFGIRFFHVFFIQKQRDKIATKYNMKAIKKS